MLSMRSLGNIAKYLFSNYYAYYHSKQATATNLSEFSRITQMHVEH